VTPLSTIVTGMRVRSDGVVHTAAAESPTQ
jgi:hypothetical protein